jgi:hypothetical protein
MDIHTRIAGMVNKMEVARFEVCALVLGMSEQRELLASLNERLDQDATTIIGWEYQGRDVLGCNDKESFLGAVVKEEIN